TFTAKVEDMPELDRFAQVVSDKLESSGPLNIQLRLDAQGAPRILEINPRFSGSAPMRAQAGFNEPDMVLRDFVIGETATPRQVKYGLEFHRIFQEVRVDPSAENASVIEDYI